MSARRCLLASMLSCSVSVLEADQCSVARPGRGVTQGDSLAISFTGISTSVVFDAENYWSQGCPQQYGNNFPAFNNFVHGNGVPVTIGFVNSTSTTPGGGCGVTNVTLAADGTLASADITLFARQVDGTPCSLTDSLAHEFGHVFGLDDVGGRACAGRIMGTGILGMTRTVEASDCSIADQMWLISTETAPPPDPFCDAYCWTQCQNNVCPPSQGNPNPPQTPILIDLDREGFELTGVSNGVLFDLAANGHPEHVAWTGRHELVAFLCLDRNGDGRIDDGSELFGNATRLANGKRAPNGYVALAEFDKPEMGGNGNGFIDPGDAIWGRLRLWIDENHDGVSQPWELHPLEWAHITRIGLEYVRSNWQDAHGNLFRFLGTAWFLGPDGREHVLATTDVFLRVAAPSSHQP
jgi:hypothetical protein